MRREGIRVKERNKSTRKERKKKKEREGLKEGGIG